MASVTATVVCTGNPNSFLRENKVFTASYTASEAYDTLKLPGGIRGSDIVHIQETSVSGVSGYVGLCEVLASRSVANGTIRVAPMATAPSTAVTYNVVRLVV